MTDLSVFVLIDALGWQLLEGRRFLDDLLPYRYPLRTVFGFSSAAIPSILTGRPPAEHGHWNLLYYDPEQSPFRWLRHFTFLPDRVWKSRFCRKAVKELGRRVLGMGPGFECCVSPRLMPHFNWVEKRNIYEHGGIPGCPTIFDSLMEAKIPFRSYSYHHWTDMEILEHGVRDIESRSAQFLFLYLSEMDHFLHMHRNDPAAIAERLAVYEKKLEILFRRSLPVDAEFRIVVFSDHGMAPIREQCDVPGLVGSAGFRMPEDYLAVYDSTMARFWFFNDLSREVIVELLRGVAAGRFVEDEELRSLGVYFPDRRFGEAVFLLRPGCLMASSDFNGPSWRPVGMHGYHPDDGDSDGVFLSNFRPSPIPRHIAEVHRCMQEAVAQCAAPGR